MSNPDQYTPPAPLLSDEQRAANRARVCTIQGKHDDDQVAKQERRRYRETYKQKLWREHYGRRLPDDIQIAYFSVGDGVVTAKLNDGEEMVDSGDKIHLKRATDDGPSDESIAAMLAVAEAKGWGRIRFEGSDSFKERSALAALCHVPPFAVDWGGSGIDDETRARIEQEAEAMRAGFGNGDDDAPGVSVAPGAPAPTPAKEKTARVATAAPALGLSLDDFADQLRAPHRESAEAMAARLKAEEKKRKAAAEAAVVEAEKRDQAINDVLAEGLGDHMPGGDERRARARRPRP